MLIQYIDGIYVCDIKTSLNKMLYKKYDIDIILNFTVDYPFIDYNIKKTRIPVSSILNHHTDIPLIKNNLQKILKYIYDNFINHNILICCYDGKLISPLIIALFIMKYGNVKSYDILKVLQSKDSNLSINYDLSQFKLN